MKDPPPKPIYRSVKTSLKSILKNNLVMEKLTDAALRANSIMIHALQLLQLYLLHCCDVDDKLPTLDRRFVASVMKVLCKTPSTDSPPSVETQIIMDTLKDFYEQHYKAYMSEELSYEHMSTVIEYQQQMQRVETGRVRDVPEMQESSTVQERHNLASRAGQV